jgi:RNA polymerase subunit RPABC4/transcription elongation factor Spt4
MDHNEMLVALALAEGNSDKSYVGKRVSRQFGSQICDGTVDKFDSRRRMWYIDYDWGGDIEEMDHCELLYAIDLFGGGKKDDGSLTASTEKRSVVAPPKNKRMQKKQNHQQQREADHVQLFAFNTTNVDEKQTGIIKKEQAAVTRPKRRLKAISHYDPLSYISSQSSSCPTGHGFACPRCNSVVSYDAKECEECYLACCYEPGVGAVVLKDRNTTTIAHDDNRRRKRKNVGTTANVSAEEGGSDGTIKRQSVEDVTDILLARMEEARKQKVVELRTPVFQRSRSRSMSY